MLEDGVVLRIGSCDIRAVGLRLIESLSASAVGSGGVQYVYVSTTLAWRTAGAALLSGALMR